VVLAGVNLRVAVASAPPVLDEVTTALSLSGTAGGLLTAAPVVCFGVFAPAAPVLARRFGGEAVLAGALAALAAGSLLRGGGDRVTLYAGTLVAGIAIAIGNVLAPAVIRTRFAGGFGGLTGAYAASLGLGAAVAAGLTVPLEHALGWRGALAVWALPAVGAAVVLAAAARAARAERTDVAIRPARRLLRDGVAWRVTLYMGLQSLVFYAVLAWLPSILRDEGYGDAEAGAMLGIVALCGIPASLVAPVLAVRARDQRVVAVALPLLEAAAVGGLLAAPEAAYVWVILFAVGQGGSFGVALALIGLRSSAIRPVAELSGMAQSLGYSLAAVGPLALGALHDATDVWSLPLAALLVAAGALTAAGLAAGRPPDSRGPGVIGVRRG
jgi:CP family cyanate transporter-like MFS transporter